MLHIDLTREVPEALKPRRIQIASQNVIATDVVDAKTVN
jgi:molecular chaperone IbpA